MRFTAVSALLLSLALQVHASEHGELVKKQQVPEVAIGQNVHVGLAGAGHWKREASHLSKKQQIPEYINIGHHGHIGLAGSGGTWKREVEKSHLVKKQEEGKVANIGHYVHVGFAGGKGWKHKRQPEQSGSEHAKGKQKMKRQFMFPDNWEDNNSIFQAKVAQDGIDISVKALLQKEEDAVSEGTARVFVPKPELIPYYNNEDNGDSNGVFLPKPELIPSYTYTDSSSSAGTFSPKPELIPSYTTTSGSDTAVFSPKPELIPSYGGSSSSDVFSPKPELIPSYTSTGEAVFSPKPDPFEENPFLDLGSEIASSSSSTTHDGSQTTSTTTVEEAYATSTSTTEYANGGWTTSRVLYQDGSTDWLSTSRSPEEEHTTTRSIYENHYTTSRSSDWYNQETSSTASHETTRSTSRAYNEDNYPTYKSAYENDYTAQPTSRTTSTAAQTTSRSEYIYNGNWYWSNQPESEEESITRSSSRSIYEDDFTTSQASSTAAPGIGAKLTSSGFIELSEITVVTGSKTRSTTTTSAPTSFQSIFKSRSSSSVLTATESEDDVQPLLADTTARSTTTVTRTTSATTTTATAITTPTSATETSAFVSAEVASEGTEREQAHVTNVPDEEGWVIDEGVSSRSYSLASALGAEPQIVGESDEFVMPGRELKILPLGLVIVMIIVMVGMVAVGIVTWERTKYRQQYRERLMSEQRGSSQPGRV